MSGPSTLSYLFFIIVIFVVVFYPIRVYNKFVFLSNNADKAFTNIDVWLQQRNEELPSLCSIVAAYSEHEKNTIEQVTKLRDQYKVDVNNTYKTASANELTIILQSFFKLIEAIPEVKADSVYQKVSTRMIRLEEQIEEQRSFFNNTVTIFNTELQRVPQCWVAGLFRFKPKLLLNQMDSANKKEKITNAKF